MIQDDSTISFKIMFLLFLIIPIVLFVQSQEVTYEQLMMITKDTLVLGSAGNNIPEEWKQIKFEEKLQIDCIAQASLCTQLQIQKLPQIILITQHQLYLYLDELESEKLNLWVEHLLSHHDEEGDYEEEFEIVIDVNDPQENEDKVWVFADEDHEHEHEHHSEKLEKSQYNKLQELLHINDQLYKRYEHLKIEVKESRKQIEKLKKAIQELDQQPELQLEIYLYFSLILLALTLFILAYQLRIYKKSQKSILVV